MSTFTMLSFYPKSGGRAPFAAVASNLLGATGALDPRKASCLVVFETKDHRMESQFGILFHTRRAWICPSEVPNLFSKEKVAAS